MKKIRFRLMMAALFGAVFMPGVSGASAADYLLVVNSENPYSGSEEEMRELVRRLLLKSSSSWPGGDEAIPLARGDASPEYNATLMEILSMTEAEHNAHWARMKQTTGETPPRAVGSDSILIRLISRKAGAFGVISADGGTPEGVRVLFKFSS